MAYEVKGTCLLKENPEDIGVPAEGVEISVISAEKVDAQHLSLGRTVTDASGEYALDIGDYSNDVLVSASVMVEVVNPPSALDYILFFDTRKASAQSGINDGQVVGNLTIESGYPDDASFGDSGLVTTTATTKTKASTGSLTSSLRLRSDFTLMARLKPTDLASNRFVASMHKDNEAFDGNLLWGVVILTGGRLYFTQEHDGGVNADASGSTSAVLQENQYYTIAVTRTDNGDGTNDVSFYIDGEFINTVSGLENPDGGANSELYISGIEASSALGFVGELAKLAIGDFVATEKQIKDAHNAWAGNQVFEYLTPQVVRETPELIELIKTGGLVVWGSTDDTLITVPAELAEGVSAVSAYYDHTLAIKQGRVYAFGYNDYGQIDVPVEAQSDVVAVAAGYWFSIALKADGSVVAWGYGETGETTIPPEASGVVAISAGDAHILALKANGEVIGWGSNANGERTVPTALFDGATPVAVAASLTSSCVALDSGKIIVWGKFGGVQRTLETTLPDGKIPASIELYDDIVAILATDGAAYEWSSRSDVFSTLPNDFTGQSLDAFKLRYDYRLALSGGTVYAAESVYGTNTNIIDNLPASVSANVIGICASKYHAVAIVEPQPFAPTVGRVLTVEPTNAEFIEANTAGDLVTILKAGTSAVSIASTFDQAVIDLQSTKTYVLQFTQTLTSSQGFGISVQTPFDAAMVNKDKMIVWCGVTTGYSDMGGTVGDTSLTYASGGDCLNGTFVFDVPNKRAALYDVNGDLVVEQTWTAEYPDTSEFPISRYLNFSVGGGNCQVNSTMQIHWAFADFPYTVPAGLSNTAEFADIP